MINIKKPSFNEDDIWASNPPGSSDVIRPSDEKISRGFIYGEVPLHSSFNWAGNTFSQFAAHSCKYGVPEWDPDTTYTRGSSVTIFDPAHSTRFMYISLQDNTNTEPLSNPDVWKIFVEKLSSLRDVELINLQNDDIIVAKDILANENDEETSYFEKKWFNKNKYSLLGLNDLFDVDGTNFQSSILTSINTNEYGYSWVKRQFKDITTFMSLNDYYDVTGADAPNQEDILTFDGSWWSPQTDSDVFIEYENILFRPQYFNPPKSTADIIGGFRTVLTGPQIDPQKKDELYLFTVQAAVPGRPLNVQASDNLPSSVEITWDDPATGDPADYFMVYRDTEYIGQLSYSDFTNGLPFVDNEDKGAVMYKIYSYTVKAHNSLGDSQESLSDFGMMNDIVNVPLNFMASDSISEAYILMTWDKVLGATNYHLYQRPVGGTDADWEYIDGGITSGYMYYTSPNRIHEYAVTSSNNINESDKSIHNVGSTAARSGSKVFKTNGNFYVPLGHYKLKVCFNGAGGSGSIGSRWWNKYWGGGGYAGEFVSMTLDVNPGDMISFNIGAGGSLSHTGNYTNGVKGGDTIITLPDGKSHTAKGGNGGSWSTSGYGGYGATVYSECTGKTYRDGMHSWRPWWVSGWGGQASNFGHGGSRSGRIAGDGAGGASVSRYYYWWYWRYDRIVYNRGGNGIIMFSWGSLADDEDTTSTSSSTNYMSPNFTPDNEEYDRNKYISEYQQMFNMVEPVGPFTKSKPGTVEEEPEAKILEKYR